MKYYFLALLLVVAAATAQVRVKEQAPYQQRDLDYRMKLIPDYDSVKFDSSRSMKLIRKALLWASRMPLDSQYKYLSNPKDEYLFKADNPAYYIEKLLADTIPYKVVKFNRSFHRIATRTIKAVILVSWKPAGTDKQWQTVNTAFHIIGYVVEEVGTPYKDVDGFSKPDTDPAQLQFRAISYMDENKKPLSEKDYFFWKYQELQQ